jgi:hypothetical protein
VAIQKQLKRAFSAAIPVMVATAVLMAPGTANAASTGSSAKAEQKAADDALAQSPTDTALATASDADLVRLGIRCVPVEGLTYCLHYGWGNPPADLAQASASAAGGATSAVAALREWSRKPAADRLSDEKAELANARAAAAKVQLMNSAIFGTPMASDLLIRHPEAATMAANLGLVKGSGAGSLASADSASLPAPTGKGGVLGPGTVQPNVATICDNGTNVGCAYTGVTTARLEKQTQTYNCGAASMQAFAWNDPKSSLYKTQAQWESILGTTQSNGTTVGAMANGINTYTHWDDSDYAGSYVVVGVGNWTVTQFHNEFAHHIRDLRSPLQMNPVLNPTTSSYYPGSTSGHYDVVIGYDYSVGDNVYIYEPAGGAPQGHIYDSLTAWDNTTKVRAATMANPNKNIIY